MVNTNSKEFREKVQAHIRNTFKGQGGLSALFDELETYQAHRTFGHDAPTIYWVAYRMVEGGCFLAYTSDILREMHGWGLTDDAKILTWKNWKGEQGEFYLYAHLVAQNCERLYNQWKKTGKVPSPSTAKGKAPAKRK